MQTERQPSRATRACAVLFALCAYGCADGGAAVPEPVVHETPRLLIVGWDGASFRMIDRLIDEGRLPNAKALLERGTSAVLESTIIPISSAAWTSAVTGKGPGQTGVYTFFATQPNSYDVELVSSRSNQAAPLWRILTWRGERSIVFGVPITYPPEPILGTMVAGMLSPFDAAYTWPPEFADELRGRGFEPDLDVWREQRVVRWDALERQLALKREIVTELLTEQDWRFAMVVFKSLDVVSHHSLEADFHDHVGPVYDVLDDVLGTLLETVGPETNVVLMSDHGFNSYAWGFNLHRWLANESYARRRADAPPVEVRAEDPLDVRERQVIRRLRGELNWSKTRAFAMQAEGNFGGIRLNLVGREPEGIVAAADAERVLTSLEERLRAIVMPDGAALVTNVFRGKDLYPGPHDALLPDLLFEAREDTQVFSDIDEQRVFGRMRTLEPDHDRHGIWIGAGPNIARARERGTAHIHDIAPTALHLLGHPVFAEMEGRVLSELLTGTPPVRAIAEADDPLARDAPSGGARPFTADELDALARRLRALGYTD